MTHTRFSKWSLFGLLLTGIPQFTTNAMRYYESPIFFVKMEVLVLAVILTFTVRQRVVRADEASVGPFWSKVVGVSSIVIWGGVAVGGRLIGLF